LTALVSNDEEKLKVLARRYGVPVTARYEEYDKLLHGGEIDAVYIALPNHLHRDYTLRAARAGVHVLCEKPMAVTSADCQAMIAEAEQNHVRLMIAYRLHLDEANMRSVQTVREGKIGDPRVFHSVFTMQVHPGNVRLQRQAGGGPLYDIGVYCINAARYIFGDEPYEVFCTTSKSGDERFREVEETAAAVLRFPQGRLASFVCNFGGEDLSMFEVIGTRGRLRLDPAFDYALDLVQHLTVNGQTKTRVFKRRDQFGPELIYFSDCVLNRRPAVPDGREGLADVRIIEALYRSVETHEPVKLAPFRAAGDRPGPRRIIHCPPVAAPELFHAQPATLAA
jgi:glucose-fructose oxidoreductase